jgi:hypothetical protein
MRFGVVHYRSRLNTPLLCAAYAQRMLIEEASA